MKSMEICFVLLSSLLFFVTLINPVEYSTATNLNKTTSDSRSLNNTSSQVVVVDRGKQVDIVYNAISKGKEAYYPNPITIQKGSFVSWLNVDTILHTATSGTGIEDNDKGDIFDSPLLRPGEAYNYQFEESGEFPYFCFLHPIMVGKVLVAD